MLTCPHCFDGLSCFVTGYRDFQTVCLFKFDGRYHYVEVQLNLIEIVAIKAGHGNGRKTKKGGRTAMVGGHDAFNTARVLDVFSTRSIGYSGDPSEELWKMIAAGSLLRVVLDSAAITDAQAGKLVDAMASDQCRVKHLSMFKCKGLTKIPEGLMVHIKAAEKNDPDELDLGGWVIESLPNSLGKMTHLKRLNLVKCENLETLPETVGECINVEDLNLYKCKGLKTLPRSVAKLSKLKMLNLEGCFNLKTLPETSVGELIDLEYLNLNYCSSLKTLPQSIAKMSKLKMLDVDGCRYLAEPLPDLSHLLPGLVIGHADRSSGAVGAWQERGFTSLANRDKAMKMLADGTYTDDVLSLAGSDIETLPESLGKLVNLKELNLNHCRNLKQLPQSIAKLTKLKTLKLGYECRNLAEPLPDLSHLLPDLEITGVNYASDAAQAWEQRGFTSLANRDELVKLAEVA